MAGTGATGCCRQFQFWCIAIVLKLHTLPLTETDALSGSYWMFMLSPRCLFSTGLRGKTADPVSRRSAFPLRGQGQNGNHVQGNRGNTGNGQISEEVKGAGASEQRWVMQTPEQRGEKGGAEGKAPFFFSSLKGKLPLTGIQAKEKSAMLGRLQFEITGTQLRKGDESDERQADLSDPRETGFYCEGDQALGEVA